jgi:phosphoribosylanthranilate isomerase
VGGRTGGSGRAFDWAAARGAIDALRPRARIALAGGLGPHNVVAAIQSLAPDIVDVSSGVETTPGVKDHEMMTAFAAAVRAAVPA